MFLGGRYECGCAAHTSFVVCGGIKASETMSLQVYTSTYTSYILGLYLFWGRGAFRDIKWEATSYVKLGLTSN